MDSDQDPDNLSEEAKRALRLEFHQSFMEDQLEINRVAYKNTRNPVYVWLALRWLSPMIRSALIADGAAISPGPGTPPDWCMEYLLACADSVHDLCHGAMARTRRELTEDEGLLTDGQKVDVLPAEFGFTRPGWNAFSQYDSVFSMKWAERYFWDLRDEGVPYSEALAETAERYGFQDERSLRRRLAKRRAVYSEPAGDETEQG